MAGQVPLKAPPEGDNGPHCLWIRGVCPCPLPPSQQSGGAPAIMRSHSWRKAHWSPPPSVLGNSYPATSDFCRESKGKLYGHAPWAVQRVGERVVQMARTRWVTGTRMQGTLPQVAEKGVGSMWLLVLGLSRTSAAPHRHQRAQDPGPRECAEVKARMRGQRELDCQVAPHCTQWRT